MIFYKSLLFASLFIDRLWDNLDGYEIEQQPETSRASNTRKRCYIHDRKT
jgi:hypothetical protein